MNASPPPGEPPTSATSQPVARPERHRLGLAMPPVGSGWRSRRNEWRETVVQKGYERLCLYGSVGPQSKRARSFGSFGAGSIIMFPWVSLYGERWMRIGEGTMIGQHCTLAVGMSPDQEMMTDPVISIGDRCLIGKGSGIVAHWGVHIGDDVFTGHNVYITDQNHGYEDVTKPIGAQTMPEKPVHIGSGSWIGHGSVVLPGVTIGEHVTVAAGSVVTKDVPDRCVVAGNPARIIRRHDPDAGWKRP
jgi:carbonic anhydrase/acetyltransferase-like protein (isoleucine patch superfamily)